MSNAVRREVIQNSMNQDQRLALEAHIVFRKKERCPDNVSSGDSDGCDLSKSSVLALCDGNISEGFVTLEGRHRGRGGICKSADGGKLYGYYAKVTLNNLTFTTRIHQQLAEAVRDHIVMMRFVELIPRGSSETAFVTDVQRAVASVLAEEGVADHDFFRSVAVSFSAQHWLGRGLSVHFNGLPQALHAWQTLDLAQTPRLFQNGRPTAAYTPERAARQWMRLKSVFVELQVEKGVQRYQVGERLLFMEAAHRQTFCKNTAYWLRLQEMAHVRKKTQKADPEKVMLRRVENAIQAWRLEIAKEKRQEKLAEFRKDKGLQQLNKKRRWDGKESFVEFKRRTLDSI